MPLAPASNDRDYDLIFKAANNWYDWSILFGATGLTPPSLNDDRVELISKIAYYTAKLVDIQPAP